MFVGGSLPGCSTVAEVDGRSDVFLDVFPVDHLASLVPGEGLSEFGGYLFQCFGDCFGHFVGGAVGYCGEEGVAGGAFGEGYYCGAVVGAFQEVAFPVAWEATGETSWSFSDD